MKTITLLNPWLKAINGFAAMSTDQYDYIRMSTAEGWYVDYVPTQSRLKFTDTDGASYSRELEQVEVSALHAQLLVHGEF